MMRSQVWVVVSAVMLSGWMAQAQGPSLPGFPIQDDGANPKGIPQPISPDAKFRSGDPGAIPAPPPLGPDGMPRKNPDYRMPPNYPPGMMPYPGMMPPGTAPYPYPGMMPPGGQPYPYPGMMPPGGQPYPGMMPPGGQPYPGMMPPGGQPYPYPGMMPPYPNPRLMQMPPGGMQGPGAGQPYMVAPEGGGVLPPTLPMRPTTPDANRMPRPAQMPAPLPLPQPLPAVGTGVAPVSFGMPPGPFSPGEPYTLYEGGRNQYGLLEPLVVNPGYRLWGSAEFLYWWSRNSSAPPALATTTPAGAPLTLNGLPVGALGRPDTTVVLGGQPIDMVNHSGTRITLGGWLDPEQLFGVEANYLILPARGQTQSVSSAGGANNFSLSVPFRDVNPAAPGENSVLLAANNSPINGTAALFFSSQLQGAEFNLLLTSVQYYGLNVCLIGGFRYLGLYENLEYSTSQNGALPGQFSNTFDQFQTRNTFYGGQLGARADYQYQWYFANIAAKLAYGDVAQNVNINGQTLTNTGPGFGSVIGTTTTPGGIFAQPTNIGSYTRNRDAWLPELTLNVGVQVWNSLRIFGGFNFLYLSHVVQPGDQMDRSVNSTQLTSITGVPPGPLVGPSNPAFVFRESSYWVSGLNIGLEVRY